MSQRHAAGGELDAAASRFAGRIERCSQRILIAGGDGKNSGRGSARRPFKTLQIESYDPAMTAEHPVMIDVNQSQLLLELRREESRIERQLTTYLLTHGEVLIPSFWTRIAISI